MRFSVANSLKLDGGTLSILSELGEEFVILETPPVFGDGNIKFWYLSLKRSNPIPYIDRHDPQRRDRVGRNLFCVCASI